MLPKHCAHCRHYFMPHNTGLPKYFCSRCTTECQEYYKVICFHLQEAPLPSAPELSMKLNIPQIFVVHALRMAGVTPDLSSRNRTENRQCTVCRNKLEHYENVYCTPCDTVISQRLHTRYRA